jgi:phosphatidylinositol glycan class F
MGAWIGAVPIPLDWCAPNSRRETCIMLTNSRDRDWQKWPITIVTGAYVGWAMGKLAGNTFLRGKVIDLRD